MWFKIILFLALIGGLMGLGWMLSRIQRRRQAPRRPQPMALYQRVQEAVGLSVAERWWMWRLAKALKLTNPTALLISEVLYDKAVGRFCGGASWFGRSAAAAQQFSAIRHRLFGAPNTQ